MSRDSKYATDIRAPLSAFAAWSRDCPLGRYFDCIDSDVEDALDAMHGPLVRRAS